MREIFKIRRDERLFAAVALLVFAVLQGMFIVKFFECFEYFDPQSWTLFQRNYHMSGYDCYTYSVITKWDIGYNIVRHPLLPFMMYPFYLLNSLLWQITGVNCVQFVVGVLLVTCSLYSSIFFLRTMRDVIGLTMRYAILVTAFFFGSAHILLVTIVPDHFGISLFIILLTLLRAGQKLRSNETFSLLETAILFVLASGVTLSNGVIVMLAALFVNGKKVFNWRFIVAGISLSVVMLGTGFAINRTLTEPKDQEIEQWVDSETPRTDILVENFFGESIQLHRKYLLWDVLVKRPIVVRYTWSAQYVVEAAILLLFLVGIWRGWHQRFLWLTMSCFAFALLLHIVLGFAINEVYIMSAHWLYVIPIAIAYTLRNGRETLSRVVRWTVTALLLPITIYLLTYNGYLICYCLSWELSTK